VGGGGGELINVHIFNHLSAMWHCWAVILQLHRDERVLSQSECWSRRMIAGVCQSVCVCVCVFWSYPGDGEGQVEVLPSLQPEAPRGRAEECDAVAAAHGLRVSDDGDGKKMCSRSGDNSDVRGC